VNVEDEARGPWVGQGGGDSVGDGAAAAVFK
jgi:hypothetical protein